MWNKYKQLWMSIVQTDAGLLAFVAFLIGVMAMLLDNIARVVAPSYGMLINFIEMGLFFSFLFGIILPMIYASRELNRIHAYHNLIVDAVENIATIKEGVEPGQVYKLSDVYCLDNPNTLKARECLQAVLGDDFQVLSNLNQHETFHELKLMKHRELVSPRELS